MSFIFGRRIKTIQCQEGFSRKLAFTKDVAVVLKTPSSSYGLEWCLSIACKNTYKKVLCSFLYKFGGCLYCFGLFCPLSRTGLPNWH